MMRSQIDRAEDYYQRLRPPRIAASTADSRPTLVAMTEIYHTLLQKIARRPATRPPPPRLPLRSGPSSASAGGRLRGTGRLTC